MSLKIWLPLDGDLENKGILNNVVVTNNGATVDNSGKIGKCYSFASGNMISFNPDNVKTFKNITVSLWLYIISWNTQWSTYFQFGVGTTPWASYSVGLLRNSTNSKIAFTVSDGTNSTQANCCSGALTTGTWYHIVCVYDGACNLYIDGDLVSSYATTIIPNFSGITACTIGKVSNGGYPSNCKINDFRVYDNALSVTEIKELSRGLVCHYKLDDVHITDNLIINGFGELGSENWYSHTAISTTEIPPNHSEIKESFYGANYTTQYIPINPEHSYTISGYIKSSGATTGYTYPSIYPYDADKKFISSQNCTEGFNNSYKTTLAQPLHKGDTIIYATNLSAWTTDTTSYYYFVAIFGYKDSFGHLYDDMIYTADSPTFGTRTDKSNIDKTNNTITLLAPFAGEDRPAGTMICQATAGSTNFYPWGGIALSSIQDWTFKTTTFRPKNSNRLKACSYARWGTYGSCYIAGNKMVDNTETISYVVDSSGYSNHGTVWRFNTLGNIYASLNTPRNSMSTFIHSENVSTNTASGTVYIYGNCYLKTPDRLTVAFWCNPSNGYLDTTGQGQVCLTNLEIGSSTATDYMTAPIHHRDSALDVNSSDGTIRKRLGISFIRDSWHHYAITYDGRYAKSYVDGSMANTVDMGSNVSLGSMIGILLGFSKAGGVWRSNQSKYSDFRFYVTSLSEEDIYKLYTVGAKITNNGEFHNYELVENTTSTTTSVKNTGVAIATASGINENILKTVPKLVSPTQYNAYQLAFTENLVAGQTYTLQLWDVDVSHTGKTTAQLGVWVYWGGGSTMLLSWSGTSNFTNGHADYLEKTFTITSSQASGSGAGNLWFNIYNSVGYVSGTMNMKIGKWKLEKGSVPTAYVNDPTYSGYLGVNHGFIENDLLQRNSVATKIHEGYIETKEFIED